MTGSDNYGAVTLQHITYKILVNILYVKLIHYAEEIIGIRYDQNIWKMLGTKYRYTSPIYWFPGTIWHCM
jgi:hypothetical protein